MKNQKVLLFVTSILIGVFIASDAYSSSWWQRFRNRVSSPSTKSVRTRTVTARQKSKMVKVVDPLNSFRLSQKERIKASIYGMMKKNELHCMDTDGGNSSQFNAEMEKQYVGTVYYFWINPTTHKTELRQRRDTCKSDKYLEEHSCADYKWQQNSAGLMSIDENVVNKSVTCGEDEICSEGMCVPKPCKDSDGGGLNFTTYGIVEIEKSDGSTFSVVDECLNVRELSEGACLSDNYKENKVNCCDFGMVCTGGRCDYPSVAGVNFDATCKDDLCPNMDGYQTEYIFDLDPTIPGPDSCTPFIGNICTEPNPEENYPDGHFYTHDENLHVGYCVPGKDGLIHHTICSTDDNGNKYWVTDLTECVSGMPCVDGECVSCSDSDGGINYNEYGEVNQLLPDGEIRNEKDHCAGLYSDFVYEYFCSGNVVGSEMKTCPEGQVCQVETKDGNKEIGCFDIEQQSCEDTDGGMVFEEYGEVSGVAPDGYGYFAHDQCSFEKKSVQDWYCENGLAKFAWQNCPEGTICKVVDDNGEKSIGCSAAAEFICDDTDGGKNYEVYGSVTGYFPDGESFVSEDRCTVLGSLFEVYCSDDTYSWSTKLCSEGQVCKLIEEDENKVIGCYPICFKLGDENDQIEVAGVVYDKDNNSYPDFCEGNVLKQYSCNVETGEKVDLPAHTCPNGCANGACIQ